MPWPVHCMAALASFPLAKMAVGKAHPPVSSCINVERYLGQMPFCQGGDPCYKKTTSTP